MYLCNLVPLIPALLPQIAFRVAVSHTHTCLALTCSRLYGQDTSDWQHMHSGKAGTQTLEERLSSPAPHHNIYCAAPGLGLFIYGTFHTEVTKLFHFWTLCSLFCITWEAFVLFYSIILPTLSLWLLHLWPITAQLVGTSFKNNFIIFVSANTGLCNKTDGREALVC